MKFEGTEIIPIQSHLGIFKNIIKDDVSFT